MGIGGAEFLILLVIVVLLFGPTLIAFWLGFTLGKRRAAEAPTATTGTTTESDAPTESQPKECPASESAHDEETHDV